MALVQKNFYGLVKQNGPWAQTVQDKFRTQAPYVYRNNFQTEAPYTVKAGNPAAFESYSSKSIIYNAPITPIVLKSGRVKRGKVERKKIVLIDQNGNPTNPSTNNFLNRFIEAAYRENQQDIVESEYGSVSDVSRFASTRSSISDTTMSSNSSGNRMSVATDPEIAENTEDINFLNLGDEMAMPGPIIGEQVVADAPVVGDVEAEGEVNNQHAINEEIRYLLQANNENIQEGAFIDFVARQDLEDPNEIANWDREYEARYGENLPQYRRRSSASTNPPEYMDIDVDNGPPVYNELQLNPNRRRRASSTVSNGRRVRQRQNEPEPNQRRRRASSTVSNGRRVRQRQNDPEPNQRRRRASSNVSNGRRVRQRR